MSWYVVLTKPRQEARAAEQLTAQGGEVFSPIFQVEKILRGKRVIKDEPLFPGYVFLQVDPHSALLGKVRSTLGARQLLSFANTPVTVDERIVADLKIRSGEKNAMDCYQIGQKVALIDGPFKNYQALFQRYDGAERAIILLNLLNQQNEICVALDSLTNTN